MALGSGRQFYAVRFNTVRTTTRSRYTMQTVKGLFGQGKEEQKDEPRADSGADNPIEQSMSQQRIPVLSCCTLVRRCSA